MHEFKEVFKVARTFNYCTIEELSEYGNKKGFNFSERALRLVQSGLTPIPNLNILNCVSKYYNLSHSYLITGAIDNSNLHGLSEEQGVSSYLIEPVLMSLVSFLCRNKPTIGIDDDNWECYEERGYEAVILTLSESVRSIPNFTYPTYEIIFCGVVVGLSISEDSAKWVEKELVECAKESLSNIDKHAHKYLSKLS